MPRWTQKQRAEQSRRIKQWKPWQKSTGPRSIEGKQIVAQNAYKHGHRSQEALASMQRMRRLIKLSKFNLSQFRDSEEFIN
jgi:hypothetical protein